MTERRHRSDHLSPAPCPKCGFGETWRDGQDRSPKRCEKCGWENRAESRRGAAPGMYGHSGSHKDKLRNHRQKRQRRAVRRALDRLIRAAVYAAKQEAVWKFEVIREINKTKESA